MTESNELILGDAASVLARLPAGSCRCSVTSPPYWGLRDYGVAGQIGAEEEPAEYVRRLVAVFAGVRRALADDGTLWLNVGDSYTSGNRGYRAPDRKNPVRAMGYRARTPDGLKPKDLVGIPWRLAFALQDDGWYLRSDVVWEKPNCMPESVRDRPTRSHEYLFLFSRAERYLYRGERIAEKGGRNRRSVWSIPTEAFPGAHFATFPPELIHRPVIASCPPDGWILDPFGGSGTTASVATGNGRNCVLIDFDARNADLARERVGMFLDVEHFIQEVPA